MKWIKIIILFCLVSIISCRKMEIIPEPKPEVLTDIFTVKEVNVTDGAVLNFNLKLQGIYTVTLFDSVGQQVITRERIVGKIGQNTLNLYTKSLPVRYLYLSLEDENNNQVGKTLLIIN
jgi:hypothetical protein